MKQEDKQLLLQDLCGRLPYGVIVQVNDGLKGIYDRRLVQVFCDRESCSVNVCNPLKECICIDSVKPYLRPMYSMTEEEKNEYLNTFKKSIIGTDEEDGRVWSVDSIDWLNAHHFDYRDLIPNGLAEIAPEGMYENNFDLVIDNSTQITVGCKIRSKTNSI